MRVIIHVGATKTGSSALQRYLFENAGRLAEDGICYPSAGVVANAHHLIAAALHPSAFRMHAEHLPDPLDARVAAFRELMREALAQAEAARAHTLILSSEYLWWNLPDRLFDEWRSALDGHTVEIYAVLRKPDQWIQSSYLQALKSGQERDFGQWFAAIRNSATGVDFAKVLTAWKAAFPSERVHLRGYEDLMARKALFSDLPILAGASRSNHAAEMEEQVNPSPSEDAMSLMLTVNQSNLIAPAKSKVRQLIMAHMPRRRIGDGLGFLQGEMRQTVVDFYAPVTDRLRQAFSPQQTGFIDQYWD